MIQPAVRRAVAATRNGRVGVIGTAATVTSGAYQDAFAAAPHIQLTAAACPRFVEFVERGRDQRAEQLLGWPTRTWTRWRPRTSTRWCSAARTTRCSPA